VAHAYAACSDTELLKLHVDGDSDAFGELFQRHKDRLWAVAIRTLSDLEEAADALQDAMISAFRRAGSFRGGDDRLLEMMAAGESGADHAAGSETSIEVMAALRQLPHDQQVAIVLVDMLDYPVADAAEVLGVALGTVKSRCARGRARLLPKLAHLRQSAASDVPAAGEPAAPGHGRPVTQDSASGRGPGAGQVPASGRAAAAGQAPASGRGSSGGPAGTRGRTSRPGTGSGSDNRDFTDLSVDSELGARNRFAPGSVLPAEEGGEEEE
jgi:RNA polymerase sigma-70 factor, ECF subfamily